jgi:predicted metal-binding membrane protein
MSATQLPSGRSPLEAALRHDRVIAFVSLAVAAGLAWAYTLAGVGMGMSAFEMTAMLQADPDMPMPPTPWSPMYGVLVFLMWWIMMIAMMIPSAAPMLLLYAAVARKRRAGLPPHLGVAVFLSGYLAVWALFSGAAALLHWGLEVAGLLTPMMAASSSLFGGVLLIGTGLYQLSPLKRSCLGRCRNPFQFIVTHWRTGMPGALRMGVVHGFYCLGCCWAMMVLLFLGGVMNIFWIAGIATYVLLEKLVRRGQWLTRGAGVALIVAGALVVAGVL